MIAVLCVSIGNISTAQNLVPNPDFEYYDQCPFPGDVDGPLTCAPWISMSSANYFNVCFPGAFGVPDNFRGFQPAHSGDGYVGGYQRDSREYIYVQLLEPLVAGQCYEVSFYASCSNEGCALNHLGANFTVDEPTWVYVVPTIDGGGQFFDDTLNWFQISGTFIAAGGEEWLTLGNFYSNPNSPYDPDCVQQFMYAYYYFDDVVVQPTTTYPIDVDLGGPYVECNYVNLDPQIPDANYAWSDGSTDSTLFVTESGTYSVVVSFDGCVGGVGTTDVIILGSPAVDCGPDVTICPGESYVINLDPLAGDYIWQDGSTNPTNTITATGFYSVFLDDGCDVSFDEIEVTVLDPPSFSLGADTILCPGDQFSVVMDPSAGEFTWQDNSSNYYYFIDEPGTYALTITNQCGEDEDEFEVNGLSLPDFDLGADSVFLCAGTTLNLVVEPFMGDYQWQDGTTMPSYSINTPGLYSLTVTNACGSLSDDVNVTEINAPEVDLGGTALLCPGETLLLDAGDNYGEYSWQNGSTDPQFLVTSGGEYGVTITNPCGTASDLILVEQAPEVLPPNLGPDTSICSGGSLLLSVNQSDVSIQWSDLSTDNDLLVTTSGEYWVHVSTICENYWDTIYVTINNNGPQLNLPSDLVLCQGQSTVINSGISNVAYQWSNGSHQSQISVSTPGTYALTITNDCGTDSDSITIIDGGPAPFISLGNDTAMCAGQTLIINPAFANIDTWSWSDGTDTTYFTALHPGQVFVQAANNCGVTFDTIMINLLPAVPLLDLGNDTAICPGESVTLSISIPNVNILWPDGSTNTTLVVLDSQNVVASISNACGISSDTLNVAWLPDIPDLDLGADQTICPGEMIIVNPNIPNVDYQWQDGTTNSFFQITQADTLILTISNVCGSSTDTLQVDESIQGPQIDLGPDLHACEGETITIPAGILGVDYLWQDGSMNDHFDATASGTIILTVQNGCGIDSDTIEVDISGLPPVVALGPDMNLCAGSNLMLTSNADTSTTIQWQDGSSASSYLVTSPGIYSLTETNACGMATDTIQLWFNVNTPAVDLGPDTTLCIGSTITLLANVDSLITATWQDGSHGKEYIATYSGWYVLEESNFCGNDMDSIFIKFIGLPSDPDLGKDTILCEGISLTLFADGDTTYAYYWQDGSTLPSWIVTQAGVYTLTQSNQCGEKSDTIMVGYQSLPDKPYLGPDTTLCVGKTLLLSASSTSNQPTWQDGSHAASFLVQQPGLYSLSLSNECGSTTDEIFVSYDDRNIQITLPELPALCPGDELILNVAQPFLADYIWSTGSVTPDITVTAPGLYAVTILTECEEAYEEIIVNVDANCDEGEFFIPNVISPNDDNINDVFIISTSSVVKIISMEGSIFDRWGNLVFSSKENPFTWNGQFDDEEVSPGVFVYVCAVKYMIDGREMERALTGDITVIK